MSYNPLDTVDTEVVRKRLLGRIQRWPREQIRPDGHDEWRTKGDIRSLRDSLDLNRMRHPIVCDNDGVILDGYRRFLATEQLDETLLNVIVVSELVDAVVALTIADDDRRVPHSFIEKVKLSDLLSRLPLMQLPAQPMKRQREKAAVLAAFVGLDNRTQYYKFNNIRRYADDRSQPEHVRSLAASLVEEVAAREGRRASTAYTKVVALVRESRERSGTGTGTGTAVDMRPDGEPAGLPRHLQRTVNTALQLSGYANALVNTPAEILGGLPAHTRREISGLLDRTALDMRRFRKLLEGDE